MSVSQSVAFCIACAGIAGMTTGLGVWQTWRILSGAGALDRPRWWRLFTGVVYVDAVCCFSSVNIAVISGLLPYDSAVVTGVLIISGGVSVVALLAFLYQTAPWLFRRVW
jgi:hypothetical protein